MTTKLVFVGSTSRIKLDAVEGAFSTCGVQVEIFGSKSVSGVPNQPFGYEEIMRGALNRTKMRTVRSENSLVVGIENGLVRVDSQKIVDLAVVAIRSHGQPSLIQFSEAIEFPYAEAQAALESPGRSVTAGSLIAEKYGCDSADPHSFLTNGEKPRQAILQRAIQQALAELQRRSPL